MVYLGRVKRLLRANPGKSLAAGAAVVAVVVVGVILLAAHAASSVVAVETDAGTASTNAKTVTDTTASGAKALKFTAPTTGVPAQCATGGNYLWANLALCGWPDATNTGYVLSECGGALTTSTLTKDSQGVIHVTANNTTISCQNITGCVSVEATGVTIKNNLIKGCNGFGIRSGANGTGTVYIDDGASATVTQNELNGQKLVHACIWHQGVSMTATKNNCYNVNDGIFSWADTSYSQTTGDQFTIQDNYLHDFTVATANGHIDGYQTEGAANGLITHNTFLMTAPDNSDSTDSAVAIWNSLKSSHDITVSNNLMAGGGFTIYAEDYNPSEASPGGGFSVTNIFFNNNKFSNHMFGCIGVYGVWYVRGAPTDQWRRSGNVVLETGFNLDNGNPSFNGNACV